MMLQHLISVIILSNTYWTHATEITASINDVGLKLLKYTPSTENVMISPYSINTALAMVTAGTAGSTKYQLDRAFGWSADTMMTNYKDLIGKIGSKSAAYNLSSSNRLYVDNTFQVKEEYTTKLANYFAADSEEVNFSQGDNSATVDLINNWVADQTNQKIKNLFSKISDSVRAIIINTIYFKANWMYPFTEGQTTDQVFYVDKEYAVKTKMMKLTETLGYYKNNDLEMIKLPYKVMGDDSNDESRKISMVIIKPIGRGELETIEKNLINYKYSEISGWMSKLEYRKISLDFPKFKFKAGMDNLVDVLTDNFGVTDLFTEKADLSGISDSENLAVSKIIHQSYIAVDENGTEAAAVTAILIETTSVDIDEPQIVMINQPFMFLIYDETNKVVLFVGRLVVPDQSLLENKFIEKDFNSSNSGQVVACVFLCILSVIQSLLWDHKV